MRAKHAFDVQLPWCQNEFVFDENSKATPKMKKGFRRHALLVLVIRFIKAYRSKDGTIHSQLDLGWVQQLVDAHRDCYRPAIEELDQRFQQLPLKQV